MKRNKIMSSILSVRASGFGRGSHVLVAIDSLDVGSLFANMVSLMSTCIYTYSCVSPPISVS